MGALTAFTAVHKKEWLTAGDVFCMTAKPFVIAKLLVEGSFNLLIGARKLGKTLISTDIALSIAGGQPDWAGHRIAMKAQGGLVIYVLGEGVGRFKYRLKAWCDSHGVDPKTLSKTFVLYPKALNLLDTNAVDTFVETTVPAICKQMGVEQPTFIVFDTWSRCAPGPETDENFNTAVRHVDQIRESTGATILALHHIPKAGRATARGSGVLEGAIDGQFLLEGNTDEPAVKFSLDFHREISAEQVAEKVFERRTIQFEDITDPETGEPETSATVVLLDEGEGEQRMSDSLKAKILAVIGDKGPMSQNALRNAVNRKMKDVTFAVRELCEKRKLVSEGKGNKSKLRLPTEKERKIFRGARLVDSDDQE